MLFRLLPLQKKVVFSSYSGKRYGDNPKIISNKLYEENSSIKQVWLYYNQPFEDMPKELKQVKWGSIASIYQLATAKIWVDSHTKPLWVIKRKKQFFIETWHGGLGMKKIEGDAEDKLPKKIVKRIKHNSSMINVLISNSDWLTKIYERAFWYDGKIEKTGFPKTDYLLNLPEGLKEKVCNYYDIEKEYNIMLYAPTMRENPRKDIFNIDTKKVIESLKQKYGGKWKILIRMHPINEKFIKEMNLDESVIDATSYPDVLELITASEFIISDYSSIVFDAAVLYKKCLIFALDENEYINERGFYMKLEDLPFLVARSNEELCQNIDKFEFEKYHEEMDKYFEKMGLNKDGKATERIIKMILENIE